MDINEIDPSWVDAESQTGEENTPDPRIASMDAESGFKDWYAQQSSQLGLNPNPDDPRHNYDYRAAYGAGVIPDASGHFDSRFKGPKHENLVVDGVDTRTGEPVQAPAPEAIPTEASPAAATSAAAKKKWELWDESRAIPADQFRKTTNETLQKIAAATGDPKVASKEAVELLALTAANETNVGRYMKAPGKSQQRGVMQITDETIEDLYRYMKRDPALQSAVDSLRKPDVPITKDVESNLPLSIALARVKYMMDKQAIPVTPAAQSQYYKRVYNSVHPAAKGTSRGALKNYEKYFL